MNETKRYIGDSVYLDFDPQGNVILTTANDEGKGQAK